MTLLNKDNNNNKSNSSETKTENNNVTVSFATDVEMGASKKKKRRGTLVGPNSSNSSNDNDPQSSSDDDNDSSSASSFRRLRSHSSRILILLILCLGLATSAALLSFGILSAQSVQTSDFTRSSLDLVSKLSGAFTDYVTAASMVHSRCRHYNFTRADFFELYQYIIHTGLDFKAVQFDPNISHAERPAAEAEARAYYAQYYPHVNYSGIRGFNQLNSTTLEPRTNQSFYFPIHYQEPVWGNEAAIDLDYWSSESRIRAVKALFEHKEPSLTDRLSLVKDAGSVSRCGDHNGPSFGVVLMHPGIELVDVWGNVSTSDDEQWPRDFSSIVLCIPDLLRRSTETQTKRSILYIHDRSHPYSDAVFMGGALVEPPKQISFLDEIELTQLEKQSKGGNLFHQETIHFANRLWTISILAVDGDYTPNVAFVIMGGVLIFLASLCLALWVHTSERRMRKLNQVKAQAESEKAALILDSARQTALAERELNDFIAHEVRNPVAAAMAACQFLKTNLLQQQQQAQDQHCNMVVDLPQAREDVTIIDHSLKFVNDLLRNMLDMHRASNKQLQITKQPTDLLHDVLEPVSGMLYQRGLSKIELKVECPENLYVLTDALRLKQVMINLGRNSSKFVDEGFIRFKAEVVTTLVMANGEERKNVRLYVDDSGCGIPQEKRERLFAKFQSSLDLLNQGTGIGLYLCKLLVELMGGRISLDDDYDSGIPGFPGTRFVVDLQCAPLDQQPLLLTEEAALSNKSKNGSKRTIDDASSGAFSVAALLPETLSVLFVDDDAILRRLFGRSIKSVVPGWTVREASNGETAIRLCQDNDAHFDLIFVDMYMASVEKQLLGTEAVAALRQIGINAIICGLSANDKETEFLAAGADAFVIKPFPCEKKALMQELAKVLSSRRRGEEAHDE